ncbi:MULTISPECIES: hypothetical protein [Burkholderia]|uniref:hypothetical protein n=1 Tax=Burkholderia TaxID=32008 RepID=UPI0003F5F3D9|nr:MULTISPECIES: hypothetical protein [Burkholderia]
MAGAIAFRHEGFDLVAAGKYRAEITLALRIAFDRTIAIKRRVPAFAVDPLQQTAVAPDHDRCERGAAHDEQGFRRAHPVLPFLFVDAGTVTCGLLRPVRTGSTGPLAGNAAQS